MSLSRCCVALGAAGIDECRYTTSLPNPPAGVSFLFSSQNPTRVDLGQSMRRAEPLSSRHLGRAARTQVYPSSAISFVQIFFCPSLHLSKSATADLDGA